MARTTHPSLGAVLEALPIGIAVTLLGALPSFFNFATDQIFEEQKSLLLRSGALMALPGVLVLLRSAAARRMFARPIVFLFLALVVALAISTALAGTRDAVLGAYLRRHGLATWLALSVLFVAMLSAARSSSGRDLLLRALMIGTAWPAVYLLLQRGGIDVVQWIAPNEGHQAGSTFGNHVLIGGYLALVIPLTIMQAWRSHWAWGVLAALQVAALIASGSRGAALALSAAGAIAFWRLAPRRISVGLTRAALLMFVVLFAVPSLRPAALMDRLNPQVGSARVRILIWQDTVGIVRDSDRTRWWLGHGPDSLRSLFPTHYSPEIGRWEQIDAMPDRAHNETLDLLVSAGVIGALLEVVLFAAILLGAIRLGDVPLQAGLAAALTAHVVEMQFGIASAASRLALLAVAAVVAGAQVEDGLEPRPRTVRSPWIVAAALAGALSPWLSTLPSVVNNPITSGTEAQFIAYLERLSVVTPLLYAALLVIAIGTARALAAGRTPRITWWQLPMLAAAGWLVFPASLVPSRADAFSAAGQSYGLDARWPEASIAFGAAVRDAPAVPDYQDSLGRASIEWAIRSEPPQREQLLSQARRAYERAIDLDGFDPLYPRHLAGYFRIRASLLEGAAREEALSQADGIYARLTTRAPTLTPLWVEWAWVDVDRARPDEAIRKLEQALSLEPQRGDAQRLRADLLKGRAPVDAR